MLKGRVLFMVTVFAVSALLLSRPAAGVTIRSGPADRKALTLTVYSTGYAYVREVRRVAVPGGTGSMEFTGVPATVVPESVHAEGTGFTVLEQEFRYDLMNRKRLLDRFVGKKIKLEMWDGKKRTLLGAVLLSNSGRPVFKIGNNIYLDHPGYKVLPLSSARVVTRPTLFWLFRSKKAGPRTVEADYLAGGIDWDADYLLTLDENEAKAKLDGWLTIENRSGASYKDAKVRIVAGRPAGPPMRRPLAKALEAEEEGPFATPLFEYHVHDLKRRMDLLDGQRKQTSFIHASGVPVKKEYLVRGRTEFFTAPYVARSTAEPVYVYINLENTKEAGLGVPLPAGRVRLFMEDGGAGFIGEDRLSDTPAARRIRLRAGAAFDITAERLQTAFRRISSVEYESDWEIRIRNSKKEDVTVSVVEPLSGSWSIITSSHPYEKVDAFTVRFDVPVPAGGEATVSYRVRVEL